MRTACSQLNCLSGRDSGGNCGDQYTELKVRVAMSCHFFVFMCKGSKKCSSQPCQTGEIFHRK